MNEDITMLSSALSLLEETIGSGLIKKEVHKIDGWNPEGAPGLHPLVLLWYKTREDLGMAELIGNLPRSRWVNETLQFAELLRAVSNHPEYNHFVNNLRNPEKYETTIEQMKELINK